MTVCRFQLDDGETCRNNYFIEQHTNSTDGWVCPVTDERRTA